MSQLPVTSDELVYSETSNFYRLFVITRLIKDFEPLVQYGSGDGQFVRYVREAGYRSFGYDWRDKYARVKPESSMTTLTVNLFDSIGRLEKHLSAITEITMFGGVLVIENPFFTDDSTFKVGLPWVETLGLLESSGWKYQFHLMRNMPLFANNNNGTKIRRK